jgi:hypothetical protein
MVLERVPDTQRSAYLSAAEVDDDMAPEERLPEPIEFRLPSEPVTIACVLYS